jgi:hypothetical protein
MGATHPKTRAIKAVAVGVTAALLALPIGVTPAAAEPGTESTVPAPRPAETRPSTPAEVSTPSVETPSTPATTAAPRTPEQVVTVPSSPAASQTTAPESTPATTAEPTTSTTRSPTATAPSSPETPAESEAPMSSASETPSIPESDRPTTESPRSEEPTPSPSDASGTESTATAPSDKPRLLTTERPRTLEAARADVDAAMTARVVEQTPDPASTRDVTAVADEIDIQARRSTQVRADSDRGREWGSGVRQWDPQWVQYDEYYRPVIANPYRQPVKIVYVYQNTPRIAIVNPLQRIVLEVAQHAAYSFTAVVAGAVNRAVDVAVGSFFGGGYYPGYGMPPPPPPPPVLSYNNVPVQVRYSDGVYEPFRVQRIVDTGFDEQQGQQRVLLDNATPAWGTWQQSPSGERMFEVNKTQQFPGLDQPAEGPLPGDYQLRLASAEEPEGSDSMTYVIVAAVVVGVLGVAAVVGSIVIGRRRQSADDDGDDSGDAETVMSHRY